MKTSLLSSLIFISSVFGSTVLHPNTDTTKCLDVSPNGSVTEGGGFYVQVNPCTESDSQQWTMNIGPTDLENGNSNSTLCLDKENEDSNWLVVANCSPSKQTQQWVTTGAEGLGIRFSLINTTLCASWALGSLSTISDGHQIVVPNLLALVPCNGTDRGQIWNNLD